MSTNSPNLNNPVYVVEKFTTSGTWYRPAGVTIIDVIVSSGGSGGGSGARQSGTTTACGPGAGGNAGFFAGHMGLDVSNEASISYVVGAGGVGGASITGTNAQGDSGGTGGISSFGTYIVLTNSGLPGSGGGGALSAQTPGTIGAAAAGHTTSFPGMSFYITPNWQLSYGSVAPSDMTFYDTLNNSGTIAALVEGPRFLSGTMPKGGGNGAGANGGINKSIAYIPPIQNFPLKLICAAAGANGSNGTGASFSNGASGGVAGLWGGGGRGDSLTTANNPDGSTEYGGYGGSGGGGGAGRTNGGAGGDASVGSAAGGGGGGAGRSASGAGGKGGSGFVVIGYWKNV